MTVALNEAAVNRTIAASDINQASRDIASDRATVGSSVLAVGSGDEIAAAILYREFRDNVQPLIESWLARDPFAKPGVGSPFDNDEYTVFETLTMATTALEDAESLTDVALEARRNVGNYTLVTVMFAVVLFLAGLSRQFAIRAGTIVPAGGSALPLTLGIGILILLPTLV